MTRVIDFDAFRAEQKAEPLDLKIGGHTYTLPSSLPASLALDVIRQNGDDPNAEMDPTQLISMGEGIFGGHDEFKKILDDNHVTMEELPELFKMVFNAYNGASEDPNPVKPPRSIRAKVASST